VTGRTNTRFGLGETNTICEAGDLEAILSQDLLVTRFHGIGNGFCSQFLISIYYYSLYFHHAV